MSSKACRRAAMVAAILGLVGNGSSAFGETSSCQNRPQGSLAGCMEFSGSSLPAPLEKVCTMMPGNTWVAGKPCPRQGTLGECRVPRNDNIVQIVYCYKRQGVPDKQKAGFCKQSCGKGTFIAY